MMKYKLLFLFASILISFIFIYSWYDYFTHYYSILQEYAKQNLHVTNPILFCFTESWMLFSFAVITLIVMLLLLIVSVMLK